MPCDEGCSGRESGGCQDDQLCEASERLLSCHSENQTGPAATNSSANLIHCHTSYPLPGHPFSQPPGSLLDSSSSHTTPHPRLHNKVTPTCAHRKAPAVCLWVGWVSQLSARTRPDNYLLYERAQLAHELVPECPSTMVREGVVKMAVPHPCSFSLLPPCQTSSSITGRERSTQGRPTAPHRAPR